MPIKVLLAEDNEAVRKKIRQRLEGDAEIKLIGEAVNFRETMQLVVTLQPHVVILDLHMRDESNFAPQGVKSRLAGTRVVAMSLSNDDEARVVAGSLGAIRLLDKMNLWDELIGAVKECACESRVEDQC